jgi:hypothetical protein
MNVRKLCARLKSSWDERHSQSSRYSHEFFVPPRFRRDNFIFIHVPKCAGSSFLDSYLGYQLGHVSADDYYKADPAFFRQSFVCSFVRHPIARFVSAYNYIQTCKLWPYLPEYAEFVNRRASTIEELALSLHEFPEILALDWFRPQHHFLQVGGMLAMTRVFKSEQYSESIVILKSELGLLLSGESDVNVRASQGLSSGPQGLSKKAVENLTGVYWKDFTLLGYY